MSYYLDQKPADYCPIKEREDKLDEVLTAAQDDLTLFQWIEAEVYGRRPDTLTRLHYEAFNGVDIRKGLDKLFEEVVEQCLIEEINYFGGGE